MLSKVLPWEGKVTMYCPHMSDSVPAKFIVIRSSTRSNTVFSDGHRENILGTFAIT